MENKNNFAEVYGKSLSISTSYSFEICTSIRYKTLFQARMILNNVVNMKRPLVFKRFNMDLSHKPGMSAARYPVKASKMFLKLLDSVEANAENKGLSTDKLFISFAKADRAERRKRFGRKGSVEMKSTHVRIRVEEKK